MTGKLETLIKQTIHRQGPIPVDQYTDISLNHPEFGYYKTRQGIGRHGDFITAPEISQVFGQSLCWWLSLAWVHMNMPSQIALCDIGPGRGTLMLDIVKEMQRIPNMGNCFKDNIFLIEQNPSLKNIQQTRLNNLNIKAHWVDSLEELPPLPLFLVANEFLDVLPVRIFWQRSKKHDWEEAYVDLNDQKDFFLKWQPLHRPPPPNSWLERIKKPGMYEYSKSMCDHIIKIAKHISKYGGVAMFIDYGYFIPTGKMTWRGYREHKQVSPLQTPGLIDITADVSFIDLRHAVRSTVPNISFLGPITQGDFLKDSFTEERVNLLLKSASREADIRNLSRGFRKLVDSNEMGFHFKIIALARDLPPVGLYPF